MKKYRLKLEELDILVESILKEMDDGVVILQGDLAAGKTTLVKKVAQKLGITEDVTSPTFSLQHCYAERLFHYDMYNHGLDHFLSLGMLEELEKEGLHFVEWGDDTLVEILESAGIETLVVAIEKVSDDAREYTLKYKREDDA
jgi:tRNA threonylcarbamoyladenosine biosynthesis protein TsaE